MTSEELAQAIKAAVSKLDKVRVKELCNELIAGLPAQDEPFPVKPARSILSWLRRKRYFDLMVEVADALLSNGQTDARIRRLYGQALIDSGQLNVAKTFLTAIVVDPASPKGEVEEAQSLSKRSWLHSTATS